MEERAQHALREAVPPPSSGKRNDTAQPAVIGREETDVIRREQIASMVRAYRDFPFLFPAVSAIFIIALESHFSFPILLAWWLAVSAAALAFARLEDRILKTGARSRDWSASLLLYLLLTDITWLPGTYLFWTPENPYQCLTLLIALLMVVVISTLTGNATRKTLIGTSAPAMATALIAAMASGEPIFMMVAFSFLPVYGFLLHIGDANRRANFETLSLRLSNARLIEDLARARDRSETARRNAETAYQRSHREEAHFRALVENGFDALVITDRNGIVKFASQGVRGLGYVPADMPGQNLKELVPEEQKGLVGEAIKKAIESDDPAELVEIPLRDAATGGLRWIEASAIDLLEDPNVNGIVINVREITQRKRTESELRNQFNVLQKLATGAPLSDIMMQLSRGAEETKPDSRAAVYLVDREGALTLCAAPSMSEEFSKSVAEIWLGLRNGEFGTAAMNGEQIISTNLQSATEYGEEIAAFAAASDIQTVWFQPIRIGKGKVVGAFALYFRDNRLPSETDDNFLRGTANIAGITVERRRAEQNLRRATEAAELANRAKTKFLANMSHELRTPLNAIIGFSEIMREEMFGLIGTEVYKCYAADIHDSGRHLLSVIDDILDISKIEAGRYTLEENELDLNEVVAWSIELTRPKAQEKRLSVCREASTRAPHFLGDQRAMRQILLNLLSNAIKFTPEGGVIHVGLEGNEEGGLNLYVRDNGAGIPEEKLKEVVEPFAQVGDAIAREHGGTGLGLSITRSLAEMHGGYLELESELGRGTRVTVTLPASRIIWPANDAEKGTAANG